MKSKNLKNSFYLFLTLVFVYVILFEFVLPINRVLPKPSILWESSTHLWAFYNLGTALASTIGVVYFSISIGFAITWLLRGIIIKGLLEYENSIKLFQLFRYFPALFFVVLFTFWFDSSLIAQIGFSTFAFLFLVIKKVYRELTSVKEEYISVAENLNADRKYSDVYWNSMLPELISYLKNIHFYIWSLVLLYEFVSNSFGLGGIYRSILDYNDFGALVAVAIIISLLIWFGSFLIRFVKTKLAFWEA